MTGRIRRLWSRFFGKQRYREATKRPSLREASGQPASERSSEILARWADAGLVPGIAMAVGTADGSMSLQAAGFSNLSTREAVDPEQTIFRVASVSKPIAATALARMVEAGVIGLDEALATYVPEYPHAGISIRQLASHTAGVRGYRGKEVALNRPMGIVDSLSVFKKDPLAFTPGTGYLYNSFDFVLLSLAMERAAGMPFDALVAQEVLQPFGMTRTGMEVPGNPKKGQALFYKRVRDGFREAVPVDNRSKLAGGGYLSTVTDIARLGQAYLRGEVASNAILGDFLSSVRIKGKPTWYGLGWEVSQDPSGASYYGHTGNSIGAYSIFRIYPASGHFAVILINSSDPGLQKELESLLERIKPQAAAD